MSTDVTRRAFLVASAGAAATLAAAARPAAARDDPRPAPAGPVYGRTGPQGIRPGTAVAPSRGVVTLLDGRVLEATHVTGRGIGAGKSLLLAPDGEGKWSVLYAEI
jgi:hypothetical protein